VGEWRKFKNGEIMFLYFLCCFDTPILSVGIGSECWQMPNKKQKAQRKASKRAKALAQDRLAHKAGLGAMRAKLVAGSSEAPSVLEQLPRGSVRARKSLKNRTTL
jgi:uncharacterized protein YqfA (UPF0365 family)